MTHHPDAPSGQPYSPPPWPVEVGPNDPLPPPGTVYHQQFDPNSPPPFPGGTGGGGKKRNWFARHKVLTIIGGVFLLIVIAGVAAGNSADPTPKVALPTATIPPTPTSGPAAFMADVAKVGFGDKDTTDQAFLTVGNKMCEGFNDGVSYGDQVSVLLESDAKPTQVQAETLIRSAVKNLCPEYKPMLP